MILAAFWVMLLGLWRDRAGLVVAFALPPALFLVFAAAFAGQAGKRPTTRVVVAVTSQNLSLGVALAGALSQAPGIRLVDDGGSRAARPEVGAEAEAVGNRARDAVKAGRADTALIVTGQPPRILVSADPARGVAADLIAAELRAILAGPPAAGSKPGVRPAIPEITVERTKGGLVTYYAGAITALFLLLSACHGAMVLIDERKSGILARALLGPSAKARLMLGRALFLTLQGLAQAVVVFLAGWAFYGVGFLERPLAWFATTLLAAAAAAGLALGLAVACTSRYQAETLGNFLVLMLAALGGAMVPAFLLPHWLQQAGAVTPVAWIIEAYQAILWRDAPLGSLFPAWSVLAGFGAAGLGLASLGAARTR